MSHHPITETKQIERSFFSQKWEIPPGNIGLLFSNGQVQQRLQPGETLSLRAKQPMTLYFVDILPHSLALDLRLPDLTNRHRFPLRVTLDYQVSQADRVLERPGVDLEDLLQSEIEPLLRRKSREFHLHKHEEFEHFAENVIKEYSFSNLGLRLIQSRVEIDLSDEALQAQLQRVKDLLRRRTVKREFSMTDKSGKYRFPLRVTIDYQVKDVDRLIEQPISEIETQMMRDLETLLRRKSREFQLNQYEKLLGIMDESLTSDIFYGLGLQWLRHDVEIRTDDVQFQVAMKRLNEIDRWMRTPQRANHQITLPSTKSFQDFDARVDVTYRLVNPDQLPKETPAEAEAELWPKVATAIRAISCKHDPGQEQAAALEINQSLGHRAFEDYGLQVTGISVEITPNAAAWDREQKVIETEHEARIEDLKQDAMLQRNRKGLNFYGELVKGGQLDLMGLMLVNNPNDVEGIVNRMEDKERMHFQQSVLLLQSILEKREGLYEDKVAEILDGLARSVSRVTPAPPSLTSAPEARQISQGNPESSRTPPSQTESTASKAPPEAATGGSAETSSEISDEKPDSPDKQ